MWMTQQSSQLMKISMMSSLPQPAVKFEAGSQQVDYCSSLHAEPSYSPYSGKPNCRYRSAWRYSYMRAVNQFPINVSCLPGRLYSSIGHVFQQASLQQNQNYS